jgi:HSF-type DNA-binding
MRWIDYRRKISPLLFLLNTQFNLKLAIVAQASIHRIELEVLIRGLLQSDVFHFDRFGSVSKIKTMNRRLSLRSANVAHPDDSDNDAIIPATKGDQECHRISQDCVGWTAPREHHRRLGPGKTAKNYLRHFVVHDYHDHSQEDQCCGTSSTMSHHECYITSSAMTLFPMKLHTVLRDIENDRMEHIVSWAPHGRCFLIHKPKEFVSQVLPR